MTLFNHPTENGSARFQMAVNRMGEYFDLNVDSANARAFTFSIINHELTF